MIVANAKQVLADAGLRRSSDECGRIGRTVLSRAEEALNARFSSVKKIVDNRNSVCFRIADESSAYLLKVNKNPGSREVQGAALRMNSIFAGETRGAFSVPKSHYIDDEFDAALMDFIPGMRLDTVLSKDRDPDVVQGLLRNAARALSAIHRSRPDVSTPPAQTGLSSFAQDVASAFPAFARRNAAQLERLAALEPARPVSVHGDFSPKNLFLARDGTLLAIDFAHRPASTSPLRDISVFAIGLARALALAPRFRPGGSTPEFEVLLQDFLDEYFARSPQFAQVRETLIEQLTLFELVRLIETNIWLDGYRAFNETFLGWLKAQLGRRFVASQLRRLEERLG